MGLFRRKPKTVAENPPAGLDDVHSFVVPSEKSPVLEAGYNGLRGWSPRVGTELPTIPGQDELLVHHYEPKPDAPEGGRTSGRNNQWYHTRNRPNVDRQDARESHLNLDEGTTDPDIVIVPAPWQNFYDGRKYKPERWTAYLNPAPFRELIQPYGITSVPRNLNGTHFSMASNKRTYPIGGMQGQKRFRNTYRLEPKTGADAVMDVDKSSPLGQPAPVIYASPTSPNQYGRSFRL